MPSPSSSSSPPDPSSTVPEIAVLVNPSRRQTFDEFTEALGDRAVTVVEPDDAEDIAASVGEAVRSGSTIVAAVGGDGTQRSVAQAIVTDELDATLAVVPGGTVNLLGRVLGVTGVDESVAALDGDRRRIDVGRCNGAVFLLNATSGYDAAVIESSEDETKQRFGRIGYAAGALGLLRRHRPQRVHVLADGEAVFTGPAMSVIVLNVGQRASAHVDLAPEARLDDGRLDCLIVRCTGVPTTLAVIARILAGRPVDERHVVRFTGAAIEVDWARPASGQIDGDATGRSRRFVYESVPAALTVAVPSGHTVPGTV